MNRLLAALLALVLASVPVLANDLGNATWSETDGSNNAASPNGWLSGTMTPSQVEPTARAMAGALKRDWDHKGLTVTSSGSANVQTLTYSVAPAAYVVGDVYTFLPGFNNTGATTLNVNGLGAKAIQLGVNALTGGELAVNRPATVMYNGAWFDLVPPPGATLDARNYCSTLWDGNSAHDIGPCINTAITVANAAGGGTVMLPQGTFYFATLLTQGNGNVSLRGQGWGDPVAGVAGATTLIYNGSSGAGPGLLLGNTGNSADIWDANLDGLEIDCGGLLTTCVRISSVNKSRIRFDQKGAPTNGVGVLITANTNATSRGVQSNDFWIRFYDNTGNATGAVLDRESGAVANVSGNIFHMLSGQAGGDAVVIANDDSNTFIQLTGVGGLNTKSGNDIACVNGTAYTTPSGYVTQGLCRADAFLTVLGRIDFQGFNDGSTFTIGTSTGTAALAPVTISTSSTSAAGSSTLTFASTTGVVAGMDASCGGNSSNVHPHSAVTGVTGTTVTLDYQFPNQVASGVSCTFTYHFTGQGVSGSYTLASNGSTYTLTAPAGGHTQSGISPSGGLLTFTDLVLPWTGTANNGDTWTIVADVPTQRGIITKIDEENQLGPGAHCSAGAIALFPQGGSSSYGFGIGTYVGQGGYPLVCGMEERITAVTVATLPTCGARQVGLRIMVSDANTPTYGGTATGGGSSSAMVTCQTGGAWKYQ